MNVVRENCSVPVFGLIDFVDQMISTNRIGVLATPSTVSSKAYTKKILSKRPNCFVLEQECPSFVPLIESGDCKSNYIKSVARNYLAQMINENVEEIILGCSHYPLLKPLLEEILPLNIRLIDPAISLARELDQILGVPSKLQVKAENDWFRGIRFCVTSNPEDFASKANHWLGIRPKVKLVSLQKKS